MIFTATHHHHHHHHGEGETEEYGIGSFVYYRRRPFAKEKFEDWLMKCQRVLSEVKVLSGLLKTTMMLTCLNRQESR